MNNNAKQNAIKQGVIQMKADMVVVRDHKLKNNDFKSEKELSDYIDFNIQDFCIDILEDTYVDHCMEMPLYKQMRRGPRGRRVDIYIECKKHKYVIELKNPKSLSEMRSAIGQLLDYGRELPDCKMILVATKHDINTSKTIKHYNLPITYYYMSKSCTMEYITDGS